MTIKTLTKTLTILLTASMLAFGSGCADTACVDQDDCDCFVDDAEADADDASVDEDGFRQCEEDVDPQADPNADTEGFAEWDAPADYACTAPEGVNVVWNCTTNQVGDGIY